MNIREVPSLRVPPGPRIELRGGSVASDIHRLLIKKPGVKSRILTDARAADSDASNPESGESGPPGDGETDTTLLLMSGSWYPENAYMSLLSTALRDVGVEVKTPSLPVFFPLTRTVFANPDADAVQIDWLYNYYVTTDSRSAAFDRLLTYLRAAAFLVDVAIVSMLDINIVRTVHNKRHHERLFPRVERVVAEAVFAAADAVTVKCDAATEIIAAEYTVPDADELYVVPDGSYVDAYENDVSRPAARRDLGMDEETFVYLFFGLIRPYKGVPELIDAFAALDLPDTELWIVGNPHTEELREEIAGRAADVDGVETELAFVPDDRIQYYMNAADVLALPYRDVLNSGTAYLGISYGIPTVAPRIGCLPEVLSPDRAFLYDRTREGALQEALHTAYDHPDIDGVREANAEYARKLTWTPAAETLRALYRRASE